MSNWNNENGNNGNNRNNSDATAFMVRKEGKNGREYWSGHMDLGGGKALKVIMFDNTNGNGKSDFVIQAYKKQYQERKNKAKW
jgi:hypothetical protein